MQKDKKDAKDVKDTKDTNVQAPKFDLPDPDKKTPEKELASEKKNSKMAKPFTKREIGIICAAGIVIIALLVAGIMILTRAGRAPVQLVNQYVGEDSPLAVKQEIVMLKLPVDSERSALLYVGSGGINCAVLKRGAFGYRVMHAGGSLAATSSAEGEWFASVYDAARKNHIVYGVLHDKNVSRVTIDGNEATMINTGKYRCWVYVVKGDITIGSESIKYS